jgi:hypothetical protein
MIQKGSIILEEKMETPQPQPASSGAYGGGRGNRKAPPFTPYKKRPHKIGDKVKTKRGLVTIIKIRSNGHTDYLIIIPKVDRQWYSENEVE